MLSCHVIEGCLETHCAKFLIEYNNLLFAPTCSLCLRHGLLQHSLLLFRETGRNETSPVSRTVSALYSSQLAAAVLGSFWKRLHAHTHKWPQTTETSTHTQPGSELHPFYRHSHTNTVFSSALSLLQSVLLYDVRGQEMQSVRTVIQTRSGFPG